ncbi:MAG: hypothetical protein IJU95_07455 [Treponema sp.]|nr:hypothetical protein [Treponema sp.]
MKICNWRSVCAFTLGVLGIPVISCHADRGQTITVEGFKLQDTMGCVYGSPDSHIQASLYGRITDERTGEGLAGIKVQLYDRIRCEATVYTDETGVFFIEQNSFWAGLSGSYNVIVSDPKKKFRPYKAELVFEKGEVSKEVNVTMEPKK